MLQSSHMSGTYILYILYILYVSEIAIILIILKHSVHTYVYVRAYISFDIDGNLLKYMYMVRMSMHMCRGVHTYVHTNMFTHYVHHKYVHTTCGCEGFVLNYMHTCMHRCRKELCLCLNNSTYVHKCLLCSN